MGPDEADFSAQQVIEFAAAAAWEAARRCAQGDAEAASLHAEELGTFADRAVDLGVQVALRQAVARLWPMGWLPCDISHHVTRKLGRLSAQLVVDVVAADLASYARSTVAERWWDQLELLDAAVWWEPGDPHLSQWAVRHRCDRIDALVSAIKLLACLLAVPKLPVIVPLPGTARASSKTAHASVDQKVLARVRGLLAKAESTQFTEEAEALSAKAQELMSRHALERAMLDVDQPGRQVATARRLWLDGPYVGPKSHLVQVVAQANRCQVVSHAKLGFVSLLGDELDLEIAELLATSLLLQATKAVVATSAQVGRNGESRTRSYRQSFLLAFSNRIGERLQAAAEQQVTDERLPPVLADREQAVDELMNTIYPGVVTRLITTSNSAGWGAGLAAANRADLSLDREELR